MRWIIRMYDVGCLFLLQTMRRIKRKRWTFCGWLTTFCYFVYFFLFYTPYETVFRVLLPFYKIYVLAVMPRLLHATLSYRAVRLMEKIAMSKDERGTRASTSILVGLLCALILHADCIRTKLKRHARAQQQHKIVRSNNSRIYAFTARSAYRNGTVRWRNIAIHSRFWI